MEDWYIFTHLLLLTMALFSTRVDTEISMVSPRYKIVAMHAPIVME